MKKSIDRSYRQKGYRLICGIDEAGRGPWAGPVTVAAVILPENHRIRDIDDSKKLPAKKRCELRDKIMERAIAYSVVMIPPDIIDRINILRATKKGMMEAFLNLHPCPDIVLIDAVRLGILGTPEVSIIRGDSLSESIAAASILAKTHRDEYMEKMAVEYPEYGFEKHKGYGTKCHQEALLKHGPCPLHRFSFEPVAKHYSLFPPATFLAEEEFHPES